MGNRSYPKTMPQDQIDKIRQMRLSGHSLADIALACSTSSTTASVICSDIKVNLKKNVGKVKPPHTNCLIYSFNELNESDKKRYLGCKPPNKNADKEVFITARKEDYSKAVIFTDFAKGDCRLCL